MQKKYFIAAFLAVFFSGAMQFDRASAEDCPYPGGLEECLEWGAEGPDECIEKCGNNKTPQHWEDIKGWGEGVPILEPLDGTTDVLPFADEFTFIDYYKTGSDIILSIAFGIAMLWVLFCGAAIMVTGDSSKEWRGKMIWAIVGLVLLAFAGAVLRFLNSAFFKP